MSDDYLEWYVESEFVETLELAGWIVTPNMRIQRGWPDRICFGPRKRVVIVEFKRSKAPKKRRGEKMQQYFAKKFRDLNHEYVLVRGKAMAEKVARQMTEGRKILVRRNEYE